MAVRQYIGARYVPLIDGNWNSEKVYDPLTIVTYNGSSYTSKKPVPVGIAPTNTEYWVNTGNYNAQVELYRRMVEEYKADTDSEIAQYKADTDADIEEYKADTISEIARYKADTDADILNYQLATDSKISQYKNEIDVSEANYKTELNANITQYKNETNSNIAAYKSDTDGDIADIQSENTAFQNTVNGQITGIRNEQTNFESAIRAEVSGLITQSGSPKMVSSTAQMTNPDVIYILSSNGHVYYHNGTQFVDSGIVYGNLTGYLRFSGGFGTAGSTVSFDSAPDNETVMCFDTVTYTNVPAEFSGIGWLTTYANPTSASSQKYQLVVDLNSNWYFRTCIGNTWRPWCSLNSVVRAAPAGNTVNANNMQNGTRFCTDDITVTNLPSGANTLGALTTHAVGSGYQTYVDWNGNLYVRLKRTQTLGWTTWKKMLTDSNLSNVIKSTGGFGTSGTTVSFNDAPDNEAVMCYDRVTYTETPPNAHALGMLITITNPQSTNQKAQMYIDWNGKLFTRFDKLGTWADWNEGVGGAGTTNVYNTVTNNITSTPVFDGSRDYYLEASGDTTDRTGDIITMLTNGYGKLGAGDFYVHDLDIPDDTTLSGCGNKTRLILDPAVSAGYAIKLGNRSGISDLAILGALSNISVPTTQGNRHGILWQGVVEGGTLISNPVNGYISNVYISRFTGGGIRCYNTGYGTSAGVECVNTVINNCYCGILNDRWSEFNSFTNVKCNGNYWGCIDNGGNNIFTNCRFDSNVNGFLMDDTLGTSMNNSHGSVIGCTFNHNGNNNGYAILCRGIDSGESFVGNNIFFGKVNIEDCKGVIFDGCIFGKMDSNHPITITNSFGTLFANNIYEITPTIVKSNNTGLHSSNNINRETGALITF